MAKKQKESKATNYELTHPHHDKVIIRPISATPKETLDKYNKNFYKSFSENCKGTTASRLLLYFLVDRESQ